MTGDDEATQGSVLESLYSQIECCVFTNAQGEILIAHNVPFHEKILWVEYDVACNCFTLVHPEGRVQDLGIKMTDKMKKNLEHGEAVTVAYIVDGNILSAQKTTFFVRDY